MDSVPQEIIDEIIDNLPHSNLRSSSLVAKRWRKRSQQRALDKIWIGSGSVVCRWHIDTRSDPGGIPSYVQSANFDGITEWEDPLLFSRVLENFNSLTTLSIAGDTEIPDEVLERISRGELCNRITVVSFRSMRSSFVIPMIPAFHNLQTLFICDLAPTSRGLQLVHPAPPSRKPLDLLRVAECTSVAVEALVNLHLASRRLIFDVQTENVQKLLVISSMTIVELVLLDFSGQSTSHLIDLPPFPVLTSVKIFVAACDPSPQLINTLSHISSAPALASVELECWWQFFLELAPSNTWDRLDRWLSHMASNAMAEGGLVLTLKLWREGRFPELLLPGFRKLGKINTDFSEMNISELGTRH